MELISLVIMILGLVALVAIFIISRVTQKEVLPKRDMPITPVQDQEGNELSTILEDNLALDGQLPAANPLGFDPEVLQYDDIDNKPAPPEPIIPHPAPSKARSRQSQRFELPPQLILFIAAHDGEKFAGKTVTKVLENHGLRYGAMDVYHRIVLTEVGEVSLFTVANGISPWTLRPEEMRVSTTPGLSLILNLPSPIEDSDAIHDFIHTAELVNHELGGIMKDHNQQLFTPEIRDQVLEFLAA